MSELNRQLAIQQVMARAYRDHRFVGTHYFNMQTQRCWFCGISALLAALNAKGGKE